MEKRLELIDIRKGFDGRIVLDGISLNVTDKKSAMIIGPNACGKTTLLKIIADLLKPDSGKVYVNGTTSMVFQEDVIIPWMSIKDNVGIFLKLMGKDQNEIDEVVRVVMSELGIFEYYHFKPREVSGGTLRKAAIARALTLHPDILLLDEPLIELDSSSRESVIRLLQELRSKGVSMIITTHYPEELESIVDEVHFLAGKPSRIRETRIMARSSQLDNS
jgi:NitT/TauT family transport system ATP-binding protein